MTCDVHTDVVAKRECSQCGKHWCLDCIRYVGAVRREICSACGSLLHKYAAPSAPGTSDLLDAVRRPFTVEGMTTAAAFALFYWLGGALGILVIFYLAALVAFYFTTIAHVADGGEGLPGPSDATDDWWETLGFVFRGLICVAIGVAPLVLWAVIFHRTPSSSGSLLLLVAGQAYMPAALLAVYFSNSTLGALWPVAWIKVIARAPRAYITFAVFWILSVVVGLVIYSLSVAVLDPIPYVGRFASAFAWNVFWFAQAAFVGTFVRNNARAFGW